MSNRLKISLLTAGASAVLLVLLGYVYLYLMPKGPELTEMGPLDNGTSNFVIHAYQNTDRVHIRVWSHKPTSWRDGDNILFVMHGAGRNAEEYLRSWINYADETSTLLLAPEFASLFSRVITNDYAEGNLHTYFGTKNPEAEWAFRVIENTFDHIVSQNRLSNTSYDMFGHSAGGQFIHRMVILMPEARIGTAIAANAGTYTFPDFSIDFPYGLNRLSMDLEDLRQPLNAHLVLLLGELDNTKNQGILDQSVLAMAQGAHRLARGNNFFDSAKQVAMENNFEFNWQLKAVPGVGHDFREMAKHAAPFLSK